MNTFMIVISIIVGIILFISILWEEISKYAWGVYDPMYKAWFDQDDLDEEQESRRIPNSNKLSKPLDYSKKRPPYWKEKAPFNTKLKRFILYGNKPNPQVAQETDTL